VAAGAAYLDEVFPEWFERMAVTQLDMAEGEVEFERFERVRPCGCVGAQLDILWALDHRNVPNFGWGRFYDRLREFSWRRGYRRFRMHEIEHGLNVPAGSYFDSIDGLELLTTLWQREIRKRRRAA
jgi:hypothetical protein